MNINGMAIYFGLLVVGIIIAYLWAKYGPDDKDPPTTPPGFRWGD
tara:strand:- start:431 stop:565 length:135 start_codon:yes stop_codon:yes gene_type:complete